MDHEFDISQLTAIKKWLGAGAINIFGLPFAGKDTQGKTLAELLDGTLLGGGDILRGSIIPEPVRKAMNAGLLIPTDDYINIVLPYLSQEAFAGKPLILSSVGRWSGEEPGVIQAAEASGHPIKAVYHLVLDEESVWERYAKSQDERSIGDRGNRTDDAAEVLRVRLNEFREKTSPVIEYYRRNGLLVDIDATQPAVTVTATILGDLAARSQN